MMQVMYEIRCRNDQLRMSRCIALALLVGLGTAATTAQDLPLAAPVAGGSEVEVIVFRQLDQHASTPELDRPARSVAATAALPDGPGPSPGNALAGDSGYPALPPASLRLGSMAARLRKSAQYELLYHGGWIQDIVSQSRARATLLPAEARQKGLQGSLTLYRERYLHVLVDLQLDRPSGAPDPWRIHQGRRLRGQAVQYFDHPQFGVILAVRADTGQQTEAKP